MKIIRDNNWKTPIGFYKYSEEGRDIKLNKIKKEEKYLELKRRECSREKEKGKAILFSTHILSEVEYISDRIVIIEKGKKVDELTSQDLKSRHGGKNIMSAFRETLIQHKKAA